MTREQLLLYLKPLIDEGNGLLASKPSETEESVDTAIKEELWLKTVNKVLRKPDFETLPMGIFGLNRDEPFTTPEDVKAQRKQIATHLFLLEHMPYLLEPTDQDVRAGVRTQVSEATEDDYRVKAIERDIQSRIAEWYMNSLWFKGQAAILVFMLALAVAGTFQILGFRIDLSETSDRAVERAKQSIQDQTDQITGSLRGLSSRGAVSITQVVDQQVGYIRNQTGPDLSAISSEIAALDKHVAQVETEFRPLIVALKDNRPELDPTRLDSVLALLDQSTTKIVFGTFALALIALLFSAVTLFAKATEINANRRFAFFDIILAFLIAAVTGYYVWQIAIL